MRHLINLVDEAQVNEAGGMLDKILAKLPGETGALAQGRIDSKKLSNSIKTAWLRASAASGIRTDETDPFKQFLKKIDVNDKVIDSLGLNMPSFNVQKTMDDLANKINQEKLSSPQNTTNISTTTNVKTPAAAEPVTTTPTKNIDKEIIKFYANELGGNPTKLLINAANLDPATISYDPLSALAYSYLKANGLLDDPKLKSKKAGK